MESRSSNPDSAENRRDFLCNGATVAAAATALAVPAVVGAVSFCDPLRQSGGGAKLFRVASVKDLPENGEPLRVELRSDRVNAWTLAKDAPVGAVFVRRKPGTNDVLAFQVKCPHAGCDIGVDRTADGWRFFCPCHKASFNADGARTDAVSESPRDMDALDVVVKNGEIEVKFQNFALGASQKVAKA